MYLVIVMVMLFSAGIPALLPLGFIDIFSRYVTNRILLQSNSSKIEGLGEEFMSLSVHILPIMLVISPLIGEWMLVANSSIYPNVLPMSFPYYTGLLWELDYELYLPFYIIISIFVLA
jgi:hypothetical protein